MIKKVIIYLIYVMILSGTADAQNLTQLSVRQEPNAKFYIEEISFTKLNRQINSISATDLSGFTLKLDTGVNSIHLPADNRFCYYRLQYTVKDSLGNRIAVQSKDAPEAALFILLAGDSLGLSYEFIEGKNPRMAYMSCVLTGENSDFYRFQFNPKFLNRAGDELHAQLQDKEKYYEPYKFNELADLYIRQVDAVSRSLVDFWDVDSLIKEILVADHVAYALDRVYSMVNSYYIGNVRTDHRDISRLYKNIDFFKYMTGLSEKSLERSYYTSNTIYRWFARQLNLRYYDPDSTFEGDIYYTENEMFKEIMQVKEPLLRSKLLWEWCVFMDYNGRLNIEEYKDVLKDNMVLPYSGILEGHREAVDYEFIDINGEVKNISDFKGRAILIDWWFTGCAGCKVMAPKIEQAKALFEDNPNILFVSISIDKHPDVWLESVKSGAYTSPDATNLYTGGVGKAHPMVADFNIIGYPKLLMIDRTGIPALGHIPDPRVSFDDFIRFLKMNIN